MRTRVKITGAVTERMAGRYLTEWQRGSCKTVMFLQWGNILFLTGVPLMGDPKGALDFYLPWFYNRSKIDLLRRFRMPVNLSIKNVPDHVAEEVRKRAAKHHRSLQGELISILEETVAPEKMMTPAGFLKEIRAFSLKTPSESSKMARRDRDARSNR